MSEEMHGESAGSLGCDLETLEVPSSGSQAKLSTGCFHFFFPLVEEEEK